MINFTMLKIGGIIAIVILVGGLYTYVNMQKSKIETLQIKLQVSEGNNKALNQTIIEQNNSINISNKKFDEVQKKLTKANIVNSTIRKQFVGVKKQLNSKPIPVSCEAAKKEMIETGKVLGATWKN